MVNSNYSLNRTYSETVRQLQDTDPASAETFNPLFNQMLNNVANNKDRLDGHDASLAERVRDVKTDFGAKGTGTDDDTTAISNALNSSYSTIYLPDGNYKITNTITVNPGTAKKIIGSKNTVISVQLPSSQKLFNMNLNVAFENITFDFNNGPVQTALSYYEGLGMITLKNLKFQNLKDMDNTTGTTMIYLPNSGNSVNVDGIEFNTIKKLGNGTVADSGGTVNGLFVTDATTSAPLNGTIKNIRVIEVHNIDSNGNIIFEDTTGVYVASMYTGKDGFLSIDTVYGYNFGKRLVKTDGSNINIRNVYGYSITQDALSVVGTNNSNNNQQKINISNLQAYGAMNYGITAGCPNMLIDNVIIDIQQPNLSGNAPNAFGINIAASQITINNAVITSERNIFFNNTTALVQDIKLSNSVLNVPSWGVHNIHTNVGCYGFQNFKIVNVSATNYSSSSNTNSFIETQSLTSTYTGQGLTVVNSSFSYLGTTVNKYGVYLNYVNDARFVNFDVSNNGTTQLYRGFYATKCSNLRIDNFVCNAYVNAAINLDTITNARVYGLSNPNASTSVYVSNSTGIKLKDIDVTKAALGDTTSLQNSMIESGSSTGTTANRPVNINVGHVHFDTTLNKPVWCKTSGSTPVWIDATGATV